MKYIPLSEIEMLEDEVSAEFDNSFVCPKNIIMNLVEELRGKVEELKEEIIFLRKQALAKDQMIAKLQDLSPILQT